jgi:tyrosine-specific transport protein
MKLLFEAIATLMGLMIGAGILGIPYVVAKSGILIGALNILVIGITMIFVNLFVGEIVLRTKGNHQITGYAEKYLGKRGKWIMAAAAILGNYGALLAYLIGEGKALSAIFGGNALYFSIGYFLVVSFIVYNGLKAVERSELYFVSAFVLIVAVIVGFNLTNMDLSNVPISDGNFFLPFGVVLFAYLGMSAIPEIHEELKNNWKRMRRAIIIGSIIPILIYLAFGLSVVAVTGTSTTEVASVGLGQAFGEHMIILSNLFAVLTMATAFIAIGFALKETFNYDLKINKKISFLLAVLPPLIFLFLGLNSFIDVVAFVGSFSGGIMGILIVLMLWNARKKGEREPEFKNRFVYPLGALMIIMFIVGIITELLVLL